MLWGPGVKCHGRVSTTKRSQKVQEHKNNSRLDRAPEIGAAIEKFVHSHRKFGEFVLPIPLVECLQSVGEDGDGASKSPDTYC